MRRRDGAVVAVAFARDEAAATEVVEQIRKDDGYARTFTARAPGCWPNRT
jgi:hypothetical protein